MLGYTNVLLTSVECPKVAAWKSKCQVSVLFKYQHTLWDDECYTFAVGILGMLLSNIAPTWAASILSSYIIHIIATNKPYYITLPSRSVDV